MSLEEIKEEMEAFEEGLLSEYNAPLNEKSQLSSIEEIYDYAYIDFHYAKSFIESANEQLNRIALYNKFIRDLDNYTTIIHEDDFIDYCKGLVEEQNIPDFIASCINWERLRNDIRSGFTIIEFESETFYCE